MNKPASELIALADRFETEKTGWLPITGHCRNITFTLNECDQIAQALRTAANQTGSERAGVDALREALEVGRNALVALRTRLKTEPSVQGRGWVPLGIVVNDAIAKADKALATPPAQPAPAATHGKPDGAVRETCPTCNGTRESLRFSEQGWVHETKPCPVCRAALSPKIAAAETSPGDVTEKVKWPSGCHDPDSCARHSRCMYINCKHKGAAIDRIDVKAEAKPKDEAAVAYMVERKSDRTFPRFYSSRADADALVECVNVSPAATIQPLYTHPTTKPEAPAVSVDDETIDAAARIIDPTAWKLQDGYWMEQAHAYEAISKATAIAALIAGGR